MRQVVYRGVSFELAEGSDRPAYFVLGVRKCGTSILNGMVSVLARQQALPFVDVTGRLFQAGILPGQWCADAEAARLFDGGNVYGGFRDFPTAIAGLTVFRAARKILLVRDPRDALISEYFSNAYSHPIPESGEARELMLQLRERTLASTIDAMVLQRAPQMRRTFMEYAPLLTDPELKLFRYEDVITHKRRLLEEISRHFGWPVRTALIDGILEWADVFPEAERPTEFIRRVTPGDYREKLSSAAISRLNALVGDSLRAFGYAS